MSTIISVSGWTLFWAVLFANVLGYVVIETINDARAKYLRKKRIEELKAFYDHIEDLEADDDDEECCEDDK